MFAVFWVTSVLSAPASAAEPVFLPDFTAGSGSEFAVAVMLHGLVVDRLTDQGFTVLTGDVVGPVVGDDRVTACGSRPGCPADILPRIPSQLAVVVSIGRTPAGLVGTVRLFEAGLDAPVDELFLPVEGGNEAAFAAAIHTAVVRAFEHLPESPAPVLAAAQQMLVGELPPDEVEPLEDLRPAPAPVRPAPAPVAPAPAPDATGDLAELLEGGPLAPRHVAGAEANFRVSGRSPREWAARNMPHAGRVAFELRAGVGMGDVDRAADVRVQTVNGQETASWYVEGPASGQRIRGELYLGYAPIAALDIGVLGGVQYGRRFVRTAVLSGDTLTDFPVQDVEAVQIHFQPRLRVLLVPLGPAKPYLVTGADFRVFDDYQIVQPESLSYPQPIGGVIPGWHGGGGLMIDPSPVFGVFAEGGYTRHFGAFSAAQENTAGTWTGARPELDPTQQITVSVVGGVQFRL